MDEVSTVTRSNNAHTVKTSSHKSTGIFVTKLYISKLQLESHKKFFNTAFNCHTKPRSLVAFLYKDGRGGFKKGIARNRTIFQVQLTELLIKIAAWIILIFTVKMKMKKTVNSNVKSYLKSP